jgi:hypothetical protein
VEFPTGMRKNARQVVQSVQITQCDGVVLEREGPVVALPAKDVGFDWVLTFGVFIGIVGGRSGPDGSSRLAGRRRGVREGSQRARQVPCSGVCTLADVYAQGQKRDRN